MPKICSMSFNVKTISVFDRQAKRLVKKFPSLKKEIQELLRDDTVYLLSIFDKSDIENLADKDILELIKLIP